jgi:phage portal protein BeeE
LALYPLMPDKMMVYRSDDGEIYYTYNKDGQEYILRNWEVLHIPGLGFDGLVGYSPIAMVKNAIGMAIATEEYGATFFNNGASPGGVLEHPGILKGPEMDVLKSFITLLTLTIGKNKRFPENFGIIIERPGYLGDKIGFENLRYLADIQNKISDAKIKELFTWKETETGDCTSNNGGSRSTIT